MSIRLIIIAVAVLACTYIGHAGEVFRFRRIDVQDGLPQSFINTIVQDNTGFLWIGTQDGLVRFDGRSMKVFTLGNVHTLTLDNAGLHANTGRGWYTYNASKARFHPDALPIATVNSVVARVRDSKGRTWTALQGGGITVTHPSWNRPYRIRASNSTARQLPANDVTSMTVDGRGRVWVGTNGGGVLIFDELQIDTVLRHDRTNIESLSNDVVSSLYCDRDGVVWVGTHGSGICSWDPYAHQVRTFVLRGHSDGQGQSFIRSIASNGAGRVYVGTRTGIVEFSPDLRTQNPIIVWPPGSVGRGEVLSMQVDDKERLWFGTERGGLGYLDKGAGAPQWLPLNDASGRYARSIYSLTPLSPLTMAIGTMDAVIFINTQTLRSIHYKVPRRQEDVANIVRCICAIDDDRYLVGTEQGLLIGSFTKGWQWLLCSDQQSTLPNVNIIRSIQIRNDTAFIGTWGGGIRLLSLTTLKEYVFDARLGLPSAVVYAAIPRPDGSVITTTNAGIIFLSHRSVTGQITRGQGAQSNEFNTGAWHLTSYGDLIGGGIDGISVVPNLYHPRSAGIYTAYISSADVDGVPVPDSQLPSIQSLYVPHGATSFAVTIAAIATSQAESISYRYGLHEQNGDSLNWTTASSPVLRFASVSPGRYSLRVQARRGTGPWVQIYDLPVTVVPPWWQTWWAAVVFAALGMTCTAAATALVMKRRQAQRAEREKLVSNERLRIARDLHDEVGAGLARIVVLADAQQQNSAAESAEIIAETARSVMASVRSIGWVIKSSTDSLSNTLAYIRDKTEEYVSAQQIQVVFDMTGTIPERTLSVLERRNLVLAVQEALVNIVKHSRAHNVALRCTSEAGIVTIAISDDGVGLPHVYPRYSSGLQNMRSRMEEVGFEFEMTSSNGGGTEIRLIIR